MSKRRIQTGVSAALARIAHAGDAAARFANGHPSAPLIGLTLAYRQIGGLYVQFMRPPADSKQFQLLEAELEKALARGTAFAKRAGLSGCRPT